MSRSKKSFFMVGMVLGWIFHSQAGSSVTQYGITWTFKGAPKTGQYANGDTWVVGPVTVVSITNEFHAASY
ncbi:MAG: hypothetical protein KAH24_05240 [Holophagae bacterium]|nr:hypothetical protein [Holophagae bacterium]